MNNTIRRLKELDLFDEFKSAMEILVRETSKPQIEWDYSELNCDGLRYCPVFYRDFHDACKDGFYENLHQEYLDDLDRVSLKPASDNTKTFKSFYSNSYHDDYQMSGLDFGCIEWNPYLNLKRAYEFEGYNEDNSKAYYDYIDEVTDISFCECYGKTPQEILTILNEVK